MGGVAQNPEKGRKEKIRRRAEKVRRHLVAAEDQKKPSSDTISRILKLRTNHFLFSLERSRCGGTTHHIPPSWDEPPRSRFKDRSYS